MSEPELKRTECVMEIKERVESPHSVIACIYSTNFVLISWNFLAPRPGLWKFHAETAEVGELASDTLLRCLSEEIGEDLEVERDVLGVITWPSGDIRVDLFSQRKFTDPITGHEHTRYFYKVRMSDSRLQGLSKQKRRADVDELLYTLAVPFQKPFSMPRFHQGHLTLYRKMIERQ